jgi:tryptophan synthase alpha chain
MGVTGEREELAAQAVVMGRRAKAVTDVPVLLGVGISTPAHAAEAAVAADGVVVGSALIARLLDGAGPEGAHELIAGFRAALDDVAAARVEAG